MFHDTTDPLIVSRLIISVSVSTSTKKHVHNIVLILDVKNMPPMHADLFTYNLFYCDTEVCIKLIDL